MGSSLLRSPLGIVVVLALVLVVNQGVHAQRTNLQNQPAIPKKMSGPEFQQHLVRLAGDSARWKTELQGINIRSLQVDPAKAKEIDGIRVGLLTDVDLLQNEVAFLAQKETLSADIRLVMNLQAVSSDAANLRSRLLQSARPRSEKTRQEQASSSGHVLEIRDQALDYATRTTAHTLYLAGSAYSVLDEKNVIELVKALAWPILVGVALLIFRKPLASFVRALGKRATRLSVFEVSIELAKVPSPPVPWEDPSIYESSSLIGGAPTNTTIMGLFQRVRGVTTWHYLIVDIKAGRSWLVSRLFLFTAILRRVSALRCVVLVETKEGCDRGFLGIANPERVVAALSNKYPWLDRAFVRACAGQSVAPHAPLSKDQAEAIVNAFISDQEIRFIDASNREAPQQPGNPAEWELLPGAVPRAWEHSKWLGVGRMNEDLGEVLYDRDATQLVDDPDRPAERNLALLRRQVPFVALVRRKREFKRLIDRELLIEQVIAHLIEQATAPLEEPA